MGQLRATRLHSRALRNSPGRQWPAASQFAVPFSHRCVGSNGQLVGRVWPCDARWGKSEAATWLHAPPGNCAQCDTEPQGA